MLRTKKLHYGWIIAAMCFLMMLISLGLCNTAFNLYQIPITTDTSMSRATFSSILSVRGIVKMLLTFAIGFLCKHIGLRNVAALGIAILAASHAVYSFADSAPLFLVGGIVQGIGAGLTTGTVATIFINNWFRTHRGTVLGVVLASSGFGGALFSQMVSRLISIDGWRFSMRVSSVIMIVVSALLWMLLREKPSDIGLKPFGEGAAANSIKKNEDADGVTVPQAMRSPVFYLLILTFLLIGCIDNPIYVAFPSRMSDMGIASAVAATLVSIMSLSTASSKIMCGYVNDKFGTLPVVSLCFLANFVGLLLMLFARSEMQFLLFAIIFGLSVPLENLLMSFVISKVLGRKDFGSFVGMAYAFAALGSCLANPVMGKCYDTFGSYDKMLFCCLIISPVVFVTQAILIKRGKYDK